VNEKLDFINMDTKSIVDLETIGITGKLIRISYTTTDWQFTLSEDSIKEQLTNQLAKFLTDGEGKNYLSFTKISNPTTFEHKYMATLCLVPNTQTQELVKAAKQLNLFL